MCKLLKNKSSKQNNNSACVSRFFCEFRCGICTTRVRINQINSEIFKFTRQRERTRVLHGCDKTTKKNTNLFIFIIFKLKAQGADMKIFLKWTVYVDDD